MEKEEFEIIKKEGKSFYFIGVTTTKSSIMKIFHFGWILLDILR